MNTHSKPYSSRKSKVTGLLAALVLMAGSATVAGAQSPAGVDRIVVPLTDPSRPALVRVGLLTGGITVKGGDTKEVIVEARARAHEKREDAKGGMRRIFVNTTGLSVEEENNQVRVGADANNRAIDITITVPRLTNLRLRATNDGDIVVSGVEGELDINNTNGDVTMTGVSGSAVVHALNGEIKITFQRVAARPMAFSSLNGDIDVTFPADLRANVSLKSDNGDVYSDFDVVLQASAPKQITEDARGKGGTFKVKIEKTVRGTINGGGPEIQFTNYNGEIYIRKAGAAK
jgi:DUF4097 and DUF4098 domain-containing protein YvlB